MKKSNLITLVVLIVAVIAVLIIAVVSKPAGGDTNAPDSTSQESTEQTTNEEVIPNEPAKMDDALFIGDSRTVGIMEYAGMNEANYFCDTGMSVFNVKSKRLSVPGVGKVTLEELLSNKKYGKIYIMLGINELGYNFNSIIDKYSELIDYIESKQPNVAVFIQANLHVSKSRSDSDKVINNSAIDKLNSELKKLAKNENEFFIDINTEFDDATGSLSSDKTQDNAHLYAKYYAQWGEWIKMETAKCIKEG